MESEFINSLLSLPFTIFTLSQRTTELFTLVSFLASYLKKEPLSKESLMGWLIVCMRHLVPAYNYYQDDESVDNKQTFVALSSQL